MNLNPITDMQMKWRLDFLFISDLGLAVVGDLNCSNDWLMIPCATTSGSGVESKCVDRLCGEALCNITSNAQQGDQPMPTSCSVLSRFLDCKNNSTHTCHYSRLLQTLLGQGSLWPGRRLWRSSVLESRFLLGLCSTALCFLKLFLIRFFHRYKFDCIRKDRWDKSMIRSAKLGRSDNSCSHKATLSSLAAQFVYKWQVLLALN